MNPTDRRQSDRPGERRSSSSEVSPAPLHGRATTCLAGLLLAVAIVIAYLPAFRAGFIWDDNKYVTENELLTAPDGLQRIWFSRDSPSQYFPLTYTTFRWEHALWGFNPAGYHAVNVLLHTLNALLLWRLLVRLRIADCGLRIEKSKGPAGPSQEIRNVFVAWFAAALFALHPVQVESVAWITERKNVLSLFFSLLTVLCWLGFVERRSRWRYGAALLCFALALFSKTTACTIPAAMLAILWFRQTPIDRRRIVEIVPFVLMGVAMGLVTVWWERSEMGTKGGVFTLGIVERILVASRALWFYAGKLIWPVHLSFSYPRWTIDPASLLAYGWLLALAGLCLLIWKVRGIVGRGLESALFFYAATLSPLLGFIMLYTFRYTFVADHYQYVASIGPLTLLAVALARWLGKGGAATRLFLPALCGTLLVSLGVLTWRQCGAYKDAETLWRTTIARDPDSFLARNNLGVLLLEQHRVDEAIAEFETVVRLQPNDADSHFNVGNCAIIKQRPVEAVASYQRALQLNPDHTEAHNALATVLFRQGRTAEAIEHWRKTLELRPRDAVVEKALGDALLKEGRVPEAISHFEAALALQPDFPSAQSNLAWILATSPSSDLRNGSRALELAERANRLTRGVDPNILGTLAAAQAESGHFPEALSFARQALQLASARSDTNLVKGIEAQIRVYEAQTPFREEKN